MSVNQEMLTAIESGIDRRSLLRRLVFMTGVLLLPSSQYLAGQIGSIVTVGARCGYPRRRIVAHALRCGVGASLTLKNAAT